MTKGVKAFDKGLKCKGFQFEEGKTYKIDEKPVICNKGFHYCENPLDVLEYYDLCESEFAEIEALGDVVKDANDKDTKRATSEIKISAKINLAGFIKASFEYLWKECSKKDKDDKNSSKLAASGDSSQLAASGDSSQLAASGDYSKLAASGYYSKLAASGYYSQLEMSGKDSVGANIGIKGKIKGIVGSWITLAEYDDNNKIIWVKSIQIDGEKLKADTWYQLIKGEFTEVQL
jgi:hypothetical protein